MRHSSKAPNTRRAEPSAGMKRMNYEKLAEGLAFQMAACVRSGDAGEFCAPFELVIIDPQGAVLFEGQVARTGKCSTTGQRGRSGEATSQRRHC